MIRLQNADADKAEKESDGEQMLPASHTTSMSKYHCSISNAHS